VESSLVHDVTVGSHKDSPFIIYPNGRTPNIHHSFIYPTSGDIFFTITNAWQQCSVIDMKQSDTMHTGTITGTLVPMMIFLAFDAAQCHLNITVFIFFA
jgi:hypothetical protein